MKYYEVAFTLTPCSQDAQDILSTLAAEAGFETFQETDDGLVGYVQQQLFDQQVLDALLGDFPFADTHVIYKVREAEYRDWNEQWEQEGFEPISLPLPPSKGSGNLIIHDGRYLPLDTNRHPSDIEIEIDARMAFGTGTHETTRMICTMLLDRSEKSEVRSEKSNVLDCGCGTGILGICALKLGAHSCTAYDIDEWSVDNTRHNAIINHVDSQLTVLHGDATLLDGLTVKHQLVMANINRNILLQDMPRFVSVMAPGATLILSGFYQSDSPQLVERAQSLGLTLRDSHHDGSWACLAFTM